MEKRQGSRRGNRWGFTLVELLVVIGVIAVLIAMLLPVLNRAKASARNTICQAQLRQVGVLLQMYSQGNRGLLPYASTTTTTAIVTPVSGSGGISTVYAKSTTTSLWTQTLNALARINDVSGTSSSGTALPVGSPVASCPEVRTDTAVQYPAAYGLHPILMPNDTDVDTSITGSPRMKPYHITKLPRSAETIMVFEVSQIASNYQMPLPTAKGVDAGLILPPNGYYDPSYREMGNTVVASPNVDENVANATTATGNIRYRHLNNKSGNFLFVDGHVSALKPKEILRRNIRVER